MPTSNLQNTPDWVAIRRAYEQGDETIKQICERFGVTKSAFEHRWKTQHWISRRAKVTNRRGATLEKLFALLESQVTKLANNVGETLGDKEAQQLTELIKNFDKITTIASEETKVVTPPRKRDMRDIREKLAQRIDQFNRR
ncbi:hypothetical protein [Devosia sp. Root635]|uniref:hypothetical protein n=1 Tax=Devosia sp. Root635 TaxID=1736575 RepID=UPI000AF50114|nr:hypothetical protein [Devosia sp. Root635]